MKVNHRMRARAARRAEALGYTDVHVLDGGAAGWKAAGFTLFEAIVSIVIVATIGYVLSQTFNIGVRNYFFGAEVALEDSKGRLVVGGAIGALRQPYERAKALFEAGVDFVVIDAAHGHSAGVMDCVKMLKNSANTGVHIVELKVLPVATP